MSATIIPFKPKPAAPDPLRRRNVLSDNWHLLLVMNQRQEGMAHHLSWGVGIHDELIEALCAYIDARRDFNEALEAYREQLLTALATKCPAAAKRIREGKPPKGRRRKKRAALRTAAVAG
jgi:hypothetical protein